MGRRWEKKKKNRKSFPLNEKESGTLRKAQTAGCPHLWPVSSVASQPASPALPLNLQPSQVWVQ